MGQLHAQKSVQKKALIKTYEPIYNIFALLLTPSEPVSEMAGTWQLI